MGIHSYSGHPSGPQEVNDNDERTEGGMSPHDRFHLTEKSISATVKLQYIFYLFNSIRDVREVGTTDRSQLETPLQGQH